MNELEVVHKTLKHRLQKLDRYESLWTIYNYFQNAYYDKEFPEGIIPHPSYVNGDKRIVLFPSKSIVGLREIILYGGYRSSPVRRGLMYPSEFGDFWDKLNGLTGETYQFDSSGHDTNRISFELFRLANQQFKWQSIYANYIEYMNIYYYLFSDIKLEETIKNAIGLSTLEFYSIGYLFLGNFTDKFSLKADFTFIEDGFLDIISMEKIQIFLNNFSIDIDRLKTGIKTKQTYDEGFEFHGIVDLLSYPIIKVSKLGVEYYCSPILPVLVKSIAESLYFRCQKNKKLRGKFGELYGLRFQELCEKNIHHYLEKSKTISWGKDEYLSVNDNPDSKGNDSDFYFYDDKGLIFLEAKTKIIPENCYITAKKDAFIEELNTWVDYLVQCYSTIDRYLNGDFIHCINDGSEFIYPVLITPNDLFFWFSIGENSIIGQIDGLLEVALKAKGLDISLITKFPYSFITIQQLPIFCILVSKFGIKKTMQTFLQGKHRHYNLGEMAKEEFGISEKYGVITDVDLGEEIERLVLGK